MSKPIKYTVAVALKPEPDSAQFLVVKRPDDDPDLAGNWGLPAVTMRADELPEDAARRVCIEKLNCSAEPQRFLGAMFQTRNSYDIILMDIEMVLAPDERPSVAKAQTENTAYIDQKWTNDPLDLLPSAKRGSCCSSILLTDRGLLDRDGWVASLEGHDAVG